MNGLPAPFAAGISARVLTLPSGFAEATGMDGALGGLRMLGFTMTGRSALRTNAGGPGESPR